MSKKVNIPECCDCVFFAGDTKIVKITVEGLEDLTEFGVDFRIISPFWVLVKTRTSGITTVNNDIFIRFEGTDTLTMFGEWNYRVSLTSETDEISTVAYGIFKLI